MPLSRPSPRARGEGGACEIRIRTPEELHDRSGIAKGRSSEGSWAVGEASRTPLDNIPAGRRAQHHPWSGRADRPRRPYRLCRGLRLARPRSQGADGTRRDLSDRLDDQAADLGRRDDPGGGGQTADRRPSCRVPPGIRKSYGRRRVPAKRVMTVQDLLRHTSGLTYAAFGDSPVQMIWRDAQPMTENQTSSEMVTKLASLPLMF